MTSDFRVKFGSLQFLHKVVVATPIDANDYSLFSAYNFSLEPWSPRLGVLSSMTKTVQQTKL